jgi:ABC-type sugar transport system substrate-binding protein
MRSILLAATCLALAPLAAAAQDTLPISGKTCAQLTEFYGKLPFTDVLPLDAGPIAVGGEEKAITIGFSQTGFNHPWRVSMLEALQAEACRHPNIELIVLDGNVDVAKQSNDVRDLIARGVDAVLMSPVESAALVPAARAVMDAGIPLIVMDRDVPSEKSLFIGQSNVTMATSSSSRASRGHRPRWTATPAWKTFWRSIRTSKCWPPVTASGSANPPCR